MKFTPTGMGLRELVLLNDGLRYSLASCESKKVKATAMKTASSGYAQRKIIKVCEDISVKYDGTVRDATGKIIQHTYGKDGFDTRETIMVNNKMQFANIQRIADRMNSRIDKY